MNTLTKISVLLVLLGIVFQVFLRPLLFVTLGIGRELQPLSGFPYQCRRIEDPRLQACEDMWLSESTRQLFLACSDPIARTKWVPNIGLLNASARGLNDAVIALDLDSPKGSSFAYRILKTPKFQGVDGDGRLHLLAITGSENQNSQTIDLYLNNARPSMDTLTGLSLDNEKTGANMTIEHFQLSTKTSATTLLHQKTFHNPEIRTPNNIALAPLGGGFFITNDHGTAKAGLPFSLAPILRNGDITYCHPSNDCKTVHRGLSFPNGLIMGMDNRLYVPSAFSGGIKIYKVHPDKEIEQVDSIDIPYPIDNLSQDGNGDIWAAAIPKLSRLLESFENPMGVVSPATVFRIRRRKHAGGEWEVEKVLEDRDAEVLPGATTAVHDVKTGRIFLSGIVAPFIAVCEPQKK
ncbi:unnamed protein product [Lecanosticta acicola]|uniref:Unnamed protein product n=1 Tax=Lecanosticta acicola TaxID=111012 RepID=A0AAI8Z319_9PEZI|nr:unnamed protein product [Lecanosticta acicola]